MKVNQRQQIRDKLYKADPHCHYCGRKVKNHRKAGKLDPDDATIDHIVCKLWPKEYSDTEKNMVLSCHECNWEKAKMEFSLNIRTEYTPKVSRKMLCILSGKI